MLNASNYTEEAYNTRKFFGCEEVGKAADYIYDTLKGFYEKYKKKDQKKKPSRAVLEKVSNRK